MPHSQCGASSRRRTAVVAGFAAAGLTLAACGGGDTADADASDPVQIGLISPMSGPFADNGTQADLGTSLCVEQINDAGGIESLGGAQLELLKQDTGNAQPAQVANQAQSLIDNNDLSAMIGAWASSYTLAIAPVLEQNQVPLITESFADDIVAQGYQFIFKIPAAASVMGEQGVDVVLQLAEENGYEITTAAVVAENTSSAQVSAEAAVAQLESAGVSVASEEYFEPGLTDANSLAITVLSGDPQFLFAQAGLADMQILQEALVAHGYTGPILGAGSALVNPHYYQTVGEVGDGVFTSSGWNWDLPGAEEFGEEFVERNPEFDFPGQEAGEDCAAVYGIAAALEEAESRDSVAVRDALAELRIEEGPAAMISSGALEFEDNGELKGAVPVIVQWQDGKPRTVFPEDIASADPVFVD